MALSFNPKELPIIGVDNHLPAVSPERLVPSALRQRFAAPPLWTPEIAVERSFNDREPTHASVLVPLVLRDTISVLLTQRTDHLTDHPGQISFPGGRAESHDADATATALREAREEIGLDAAHVDVIGSLPTYTTGTGFIVTPVVALINSGYTVIANDDEVADVFEVPLAFLLDSANHRIDSRFWRGAERRFHAMPYEQRYIWGATAGIVRTLHRRLITS